VAESGRADTQGIIRGGQHVNLLMLSGDTSLAQGRDSTFSQMIRRLSAHWDRIDVICPRAPGTGAVNSGSALSSDPRQFCSNVVVHPSPWTKLLQPLFILRRGRALFAERDYALVTSHDFGLFLNGIGAWLLTRHTGVPYVSEIHHVEGYPRAVTWRESVYRALAMAYIRWVWRRAAAIRVVNAVEMPGLLRSLGVPSDKIRVLPSLYIDFDVFWPMSGESRQFDVLFVGRLAANKGLFTLLDAITRVKPDRPTIRLGILGQGPLRSPLERRIAALGLADQVSLIPRLDSAHDVARLMNRAGMLVCASTSEGGPRVTVEAMACGIPVISTPVGVMAELLEDGVNGLSFRWDAAELADRIRLLLADDVLRARIAEQGRQTVQRFRADEVIAQYARGYHELIRRKDT
jgi:glycosyltransferase involved in cell wall biosynthesis